MDETSSATDISSSLSEFVRKEKLLKELYQDKPKAGKPAEVERLKYNDEEIDGILQQMGRLLSPAGEDVDNSVYKHVIEETENKSIEQILNEAKELVKESTPKCESISPCFSTDDLSSEYTENDITFINIKSTTDDDMDYNGNNFGESTDDDIGIKLNNSNKLNNYKKYIHKGSLIPVKNFPDTKKKSLNILQNLITSKKKTNKNEYSANDEVEFLKKEVDRFNQQYLASKEECLNLKKELSSLQRKWQEREERLIEECQHLKKELSSVSLQKVKNLQSKLNTANEMINKLNENFRNATEEWTKREMKLIEECNHLKYQITNTPKAIAPDVERIQEQLKDTQELNLKLKFDFDSCKDKCVALEHLCADLKKVIMDEQIAEKLYANDNIPATVKQFLSSSSSSVINTLSQVFGCLSKSSARNRHRDGSLRKELFTTNESLMINDLSRTFEHNEIIKELIKEKEHLKRENLDLNRQVKELEQIVRRRAHPNFSHVSEIIKSNESKQYEQESETIKNLKKELLEKQHVIIDLKNQLVESKAKYDQNLLNLQGKVVNIQEESIKLKEELDKKKHIPVNHGPKCKRRGRTCDPPPPSVRNFRVELSAKEREIQTLNKQLEEMKKTNRKLTKERGQYVSYLSSKEQSADDIHFSRRLPSEVNSEMNSPDKPISDFISRKNSNTEFQNDYNDIDLVDVQNSKNIEDTNKSKPTNIDQMKKNLKPEGKDVNVDSKDPNDYKSLSDKLNYLEEKHQNLQQITCNLLTLFAKDGIENPQNKLPTDKDGLDQREELHRFVSALKEFSN